MTAGTTTRPASIFFFFLKKNGPRPWSIKKVFEPTRYTFKICQEWRQVLDTFLYEDEGDDLQIKQGVNLGIFEVLSDLHEQKFQVFTPPSQIIDK